MSQSISTGRRRHVAVCAFPFGSHAASILPVIHQLAAASPDVRFTFFNTEKSNANLFKGGETPLPNIVPHPVHDGVPTGHVFSGRHPMEPIEMFLRGGAENFGRSMAEVETETGVEISCVVSDAFLWFCGSIAEEKGVSWVPLWSSGEASLSAHLHTDLVRTTFGAQAQGVEARKDETVDIIPGFSAVRIRDLQEGVVMGDLSSPFSQMLHSMAKMLPKATAVAMNSFDGLNPEITSNLKNKLHNSLNIGPFSLLSPPPAPGTTGPVSSDEYGCIRFLEGRDPASVAYIGFGRMATPSDPELVALAEALEEASDQISFIWSLDDNAKAKLPQGFIEKTAGRGKVVPWAPQVALLAHPAVGVFVTHCGWNSLLESIVIGVPMICRPFFGDHFLNTRFTEAVWQIGTGVEGNVFSKRGILEALNKVMNSKEGKQMRENIMGLKQVAEAAVQPHGSSTMNLASLIQIITK
ncbi:hypothetical protein Dimus_002438 [Dionaea muscipula]